MKYEGKLYGKIGRKYFDTGKTSDDWDKLEKRNKEANEFILDIANLLEMEIDGIGFDGITFTIDECK
jgi:hypothetical protein